MKAAKLRSMKSANPASSKSDDGKLALPFAKKKPVVQAATVDGTPARPRLDRPGRKRADGGRISEESKAEAAKLRKESNRESWGGSMLTGGGLGTLLGAGKGRLLAKGIGAAATAAGLPVLNSSNVKAKEADRIEKGLVKDGEEDRKSGGRVTQKGK